MEHLLLKRKCSNFHNVLKKSYISKATKDAREELRVKRAHVSPNHYLPGPSQLPVVPTVIINTHCPKFGYSKSHHHVHQHKTIDH